MAEPSSIIITQPRTAPGRYIDIAVSYQAANYVDQPRGYYVSFLVYEITKTLIKRYPLMSGTRRALLCEARRFSQRQLEAWATHSPHHHAYQELAARFIPKPPTEVAGVAPSPEIPF